MSPNRSYKCPFSAGGQGEENCHFAELALDHARTIKTSFIGRLRFCDPAMLYTVPPRHTFRDMDSEDLLTFSGPRPRIHERVTDSDKINY